MPRRVGKVWLDHFPGSVTYSSYLREVRKGKKTPGQCRVLLW